MTHSLDAKELGRIFPGRWNPRRVLPSGLEPLVAAFAMALEEAGWWKPGLPDPVEGGLVLGSDSHSHGAAWGFARDLMKCGGAGLSPTGFLFSLPSSATALVGILFGLRGYQATVSGPRCHWRRRPTCSAYPPASTKQKCAFSCPCRGRTSPPV